MRGYSFSQFAAAAVLAASFALPGVAAANPSVSNGSFNNCTTSGGAAATCSTTIVQDSTGYGPGATTEYLQGWSTNSTYSYLVTPSALSNGTITLVAPSGSGTISMQSFTSFSPDGANFLLEDPTFNLQTGTATNGGTLSQTVTGLLVGTVYQVTFYQALSQQTGYSGTDSAYWQVGFGNSTLNSTTQTITGGAFTGWIPITLSFIASATSQVLSFTGYGTGAPPFLALDGVSIVTTVPEPATWALFGVGLAGLIYARRRQQQAR